MRLIDADALPLVSIDSTDVTKHISEHGSGIPAVLFEDIETAPTVVELVRCRDCKYYEGRHWCGLNKTNFDPDEFCSYGERE